jgi:predicted ATPase
MHNVLPLTALMLDNVLAFRSVQLRTAPLTLLSGTNSSGKSSVLHALALLRQSERAHTLPRSLLLNGELVQLGTGRDLLHSEPAELSGFTQAAIGISLSTNAGAARWVAEYDAEADLLPLLAAPDGPVASCLFAPGFQYLAADRIVPAVTYPKTHEAVVQDRFLGVHGENSANYLRIHGDQPTICVNTRNPTAAGSDLLSQANAWLDVLSPGTVLSVADVPGTDFVRFSYQQRGPQVRSESHRATNVGFGLTYSLPIVLATLDAAPGALLLIENPEAHLHPHGQAIMGRLCALAAAGGAQVVVETHSDHVLNAVRLAVKRQELPHGDVVMHFLSREQNALDPHVVTLDIAADGMMPQWPAGFFDEWDRAVDELLD